jgi:P-type conjugative transfer protein TrbJ
MMTLQRRTRAMTLLFASTCIAAGVARAQVVVYDPAVHLSTGLTHAEALVQTATQIKMLKDMIENSLRSGSPSWGELNEILNQIESTLQSGQAIAYTLEDIDGRFRAAYPGYDPADDYAALYRGWSATLLDTLRATLAATGVNARDARTIDDVLVDLRLRNSRSTGRMQALQIANALASRELEELAKLRHLVAASTNAQNIYLATQEAREAAAVASFDRFLGEPETEIPTQQPGLEPSFHWPFRDGREEAR